MIAQLLKGAAVVEAIDADLTHRAEVLQSKGAPPKLAIVRVGERADDISYERGASKRAQKVGVAVQPVALAASVSEDELISVIVDLNNDPSVHGVLLFRPLPAPINEERVCNALLPQKDVDGITDLSLAGVFAGVGTGFAPCTAQACMEILAYYDIELEGKNAVVVGRSLVVGKPVAMMLLGKQATVTIAHSRTHELMKVTREADIVIACVGRTEMLNDDYLHEGQVVIDVGINLTRNGNLVGDVDFEDAEELVAAITPVPGGVGTVTTSVLMKHVIEAAENLQGLSVSEGQAL